MAESTKGKTEAKQDGKFAKQNACTLIAEAAWKISFIRDVAFGRALNAEEEHVGITPDGEQGLGLILEEISRDLNMAIDML